MLDPVEGQLADVDHAFQAAQIDEGAIILEGGDGALEHGALLEIGADGLGAEALLLFQQHSAGDYQVDVAAALVLGDAKAQMLVDELRQVLDEAQIHLGSRAKGALSRDLDLDATLDHRRHPAMDGQLLAIGLFQFGHAMKLPGLLIAQAQGTVLLNARHRRRHLVAHRNGQLPLRVA